MKDDGCRLAMACVPYVDAGVAGKTFTSQASVKASKASAPGATSIVLILHLLTQQTQQDGWLQTL